MRYFFFGAVLASLILAPYTIQAATEAAASSQSSDASSDRALRADQLRESLGTPGNPEDTYLKTLDAYVKKQTKRRTDCHRELREADKNTQLSVLERCYRTDLTAEREFLGHQITYITNLPGVTSSVRADALRQINLLSGAMDTIVTAIDSGVFQKKEDVAESRVRLLQNYRTTTWDVLSSVRADREISTLDLLLSKNGVSQNETLQQCLLTEENALREYLGESPASRPPLSPILAKTQECMNQMENSAANSGSGSETR